ncbi:MAG: histidinol-phosphatase HisJ family protein [Oscillospiraceae bacterium]|nr:histidinol-phosphatase HisJ family protein [Oscillospiraceae bacterium]
MNGFFDCHVHTCHSYDCETPPEALCEAALAAGLAGIAVTDHVETQGISAPGMEQSAADSFAAAKKLRAAYAGRLTVLCGIELGDPLSDLPRAERVLAARPYDMVLASVHSTPEGLDYYYFDFSNADIGAEISRYFDTVLRTAEWGRFHALAHLTYPFRYLPADKYPANYDPWQSQIDAVLLALAGRGLALEINTAGLRGPCGSNDPRKLTSPDFPIIKRFRELGGRRVTLGSDAHCAGDVGLGLAEAAVLAWEAGLVVISD